MSGNNKGNKFSPYVISMRKLTREQKYSKLLDWCKKNERKPHNYTECTEEEKYLGQFYINRTSSINRKEAEAWELDRMKEINSLCGKEVNIVKSLTDVMDFCEKNGFTPKQTGSTQQEQDLAGELLSYINRVKYNDGKHITEETESIYTKILGYKNKVKVDFEARLTEIYSFCEFHNRTPSHTTDDVNEKKLAEMLSAIKYKMKRSKPNEILISLLEKIETRRNRISRDQLSQKVIDFINTHNRIPTIDDAKDKTHRKLRSFIFNVKKSIKNGTATQTDKELFDSHIKQILSV